MPNFDFKSFLNLLAALFASIGGASVVIIALSKYFGDFLSRRLLDSYKHKHESELEGIKNKYSKELEQTKTELEKAKSAFIRYSEKQFELYNELWKILLYTKNQADSLWEQATPEKIPSFSEQIKLTKDAVNDNMLLIEENHYNKLIQLIKQFEGFQFGKNTLIELRDLNAEEINHRGILQADVRATIQNNGLVKQRYDELIMEIGKSFRSQIKG